MANCIVMFSGGCNSTYALWKWLKNTDHDVTAVRGRIQDAEPGRVTEADESSRAAQIASWLKENVREFNFETVDFPKYEYEQGLLRPGFAATYNYGALRPRYTAYGQVIADKNPDSIVIGYSIENTSVYSYPNLRHLVENPDVEIFFSSREDPIPQGDDYDHSAVSKTLSGKCFQYAALPEGLKSLCKNWNGNEDHPRNINMLTWKAINKWLDDGKDPAEFDRYCSELGCYGAYLDQADPATALWRSSAFNSDGYIENYLADLAGIERLFKFDEQ